MPHQMQPAARAVLRDDLGTSEKSPTLLSWALSRLREMMSFGTPACFACLKMRPRRTFATGSAPPDLASLDMSLPMRPYVFAFRLSCLPCDNKAGQEQADTGCSVSGAQARVGQSKSEAVCLHALLHC